jgi:hypothetical protein
MRILLGLILPTLFILLPVIYQVVLTSRKMLGKTRQRIGITLLYAMFMEAPLSLAACFIARLGLEWGRIDIKCLSPVFAFMFFGLLLSCTVIPLIAAAGYLLQGNKQKPAPISVKL